MAGDDSVTVSFRLNLNRDEDREIQGFLYGEAVKNCFGDKSKFIKSALIREIQGIKREESEVRLVSEMDNQRNVIQNAMTGEADRIIDAVKRIVKEEVERLVGMQIVREKPETGEVTGSIPKGTAETEPCFGEVPESSGEDVSEDVMAFLENL